ncbi:MAG: hypothetical protein AAFY17_04920 [Cyanobacteria bacterium J06642_11]
MSSVQTGQLISLLINNVLMVITVTVLAMVAWWRWRWLQFMAVPRQAGAASRRCRWAYISFLLTVVTQLGMLASLGALTLRAIVNFDVLVIGAMGFFLVGVLALLLASGLWLWDICGDVAIAPRRRRRAVIDTHAVALLPTSMAAGMSSQRRRKVRRSRR